MMGLIKDKDSKVRSAAAIALGHTAGFTQSGRYLDAVDQVKEKSKAIYKNIETIMK